MAIVMVMVAINLLASLYCIIAVKKSAVVTWHLIDRLEETNEETLNILFNEDKIKAYAAEHPGSEIDLGEIL